MKGFFDHSGVRALWRIITNEDVDQEDESSESSRLPALWKRMDKVTAHSNLSITQVQKFTFIYGEREMSGLSCRRSPSSIQSCPRSLSASGWRPLASYTRGSAASRQPSWTSMKRPSR